MKKKKNNNHGGKREGAGAKTIPPYMKKVPVGLKLPRWLIEFMRIQNDSRAVQIEKAVCDYYGIKPPSVEKD